LETVRFPGKSFSGNKHILKELRSRPDDAEYLRPGVKPGDRRAVRAIAYGHERKTPDAAKNDMSQRKTVRELQESGGWNHLSKEEQSFRLAAEAPPTPGAFEFGMPPRPPRLSPRETKWWDFYAAELFDRRILATTDTALLMTLVAAKLTGDSSGLTEAVAVLEAREPFPVPRDNQHPEPTPEPIVPNAEDTARDYAANVTSGNIVAGKFLKLACKRFLADLDRTDIFFDPAAAQHVVNYVTRLGVGLLPWQVFVLANLFGFKLPSGLRRFRYGFVILAKKNGKSTLSAALSLYMADPLGDGEPYSNCYVAATTRQQAQSICFKAACRMRDENPHISGATKVWKSKASIAWPTSLFEPLAANSEKLNGLNIHFGVLDELGDHSTSDLHNIFTSSTAGRKQPMILSITTAGENHEQIAYEQRNRAAQVLEGAIPGDSFFAYIAELDEGDSPADETVWIKANPSLGVLVQIEGIRDLAQQAAAIPSSKRAFLRYSFNIWPATTLTSWISIDDLKAPGCAYLEETDKALAPLVRIANAEEKLKHNGWQDLSKLSDAELAKLMTSNTKRKCYAGLDLAMVNDLSALCLLFPPPLSNPDGIWQALFRVWCPQEGIVRRSKEQRVPYQQWADGSFIKPTHGDVTDNSFILGEILNLRKRFQIVELGFDRTMALDLTRSLELEGLKVVEVSQGFGLSPAINRLSQLVIAHKFCTFGHPVANWCFSNVKLAYGFKGDARMERVKSREKIDCAAAAAIAMQVVLGNSHTVTPVNGKGTSASDRMKLKFI
jgi:phage terminase large subunit-like protein